MTDLARYNPFRGLTRFNPFGRDMDDLLTGFFPTPMSLNPMADLHMPIDITEDDKVYKVRAEMPGFNKEDISCLLYTSPSPRDGLLSRMPSSA